METKGLEPIRGRDFGEQHEANYVIANEFGHRVIKSDEMAQLMTDSADPEEFQRLRDQAIARAN